MRVIAVMGWATLAVVAANCADVNNDNPGVDINAMQMDASMGDGGMGDGGMGMDGGMGDGGMGDGGMGDGGMGDGGMDDGGMGMDGDELKLPAGPALIVAQTAASKRGLASFDLTTGAVHDRLLFEDFRIDGSMVAGVSPGLVTRLSIDSSGALLHISVGTPARAIVFHLQQSQQLSDSYVGGVGDSTGRHALSASTAVVYAVSPPAGRVTRLVAAAGTFSSVNAGGVSALVSPNSAHVAPDGKIYVGSASSAKRGYVVFDDTGTLAYNAGLSINLSDSLTGAEGSQPGPCATPSGKSYFYCTSAAFLADGGTSGGYLWKLSSGSAPKQVAAGLTAVGPVVASPGGERLFVGDGQILRSYWVRDAPDAPAAVGTFDVGGQISDIALAGDGQYVYVSSAAANALVKVRAWDMTEAARYTDLENPGPLVFKP